MKYTTEEAGWINSSPHEAVSRCLVHYARAFNTLDVKHLKSILAPNSTYDSQSVFETMQGRTIILDYFAGKLRAIKQGRKSIVAELAIFPGGDPCVALYQASSEMDTNWLDNPIAAMTIKTNPFGQASALLMVTCAPSPASVKGKGIYPGRETPTGENPKRFIRRSDRFDEITLYVYYLDGETGLDQAMKETIAKTRQMLPEINVVETNQNKATYEESDFMQRFRFSGFPSVGAMYKDKPIFCQQGLIDADSLIVKLREAAPLYVC